jgi:hypothetical protein
MPAKISPGLFARVMALPDAAREDLLEFMGGSPVDDTCLAALIDEISERIETDRARRKAQFSEPN